MDTAIENWLTQLLVPIIGGLDLAQGTRLALVDLTTADVVVTVVSIYNVLVADAIADYLIIILGTGLVLRNLPWPTTGTTADRKHSLHFSAAFVALWSDRGTHNG